MNTLRILLSTDNHLGYAEDDNIRGNDSFAALEEVLFLAKEYRCDMVLLAGDLFHHNRPTRRTLYKTMDIFKRYCMGPGAIQVQIVSGSADDATAAVAAAGRGGGGGGGGGATNKNTNTNSPFVRGYVNYEDENYSVDLPVFSIHGNHDDPSRDGGNSELYAALDLLDVSNLVNYFGKQQDAKDIRVDPILLKKGTTQVALYGLGSMRDERLNRMWRGEHLTFSRPAEQDPNNNKNGGGGGNNGNDDPAQQWFNIFALHQNRDRGRGAKNCIKEDMIPDWMDFICWGHEHECDIEVTESVVGTFRISQPGSSVATSLVEGESMRKKIGILDIREGQFRLTAIPLTQVRSFVLGTVRLADERNLDPDEPKVDTKVSKLLEDKVRVLIHDAREKRRELLIDAEEGGNVLAKYYNNSNDDGIAGIPLKHTLHKEDEVLVRLKVDHTGFAAVNSQRFGAKFVGETANPSDILLFTRKRSESKSQTKSMKEVKPIEPGDVEEMDIEELIVEQFEASNTRLELFDDKKISLALDAYVGKSEARAINEALEKLLGKQQNRLFKSGVDTAAEGLGKVKPEDADDKPDMGKKKKGKKTKRTKSEDYDEEEEDAEQSFEDNDMMEEDPPPKSRS
ncbi:DNA repair exonuclease, partial [Fragilariopsis cylindrus CCMP1102]